MVRPFALMLSLLFGLGNPASASIFDSEVRVEARVKAIAVGSNVRVKFETPTESGGDRDLFLSFCSDKNSKGTARPIKTDMKLIRHAMRTGQKLRIEYTNLFGKCIRRVQNLESSEPGQADKKEVLSTPQSV